MTIGIHSVPPDRFLAAVMPRREVLDVELVIEARRYPNKFLPTLLSWWTKCGRELSSALKYELTLHRERRQRYLEVQSSLCSNSLGIRPLKGFAVESLYPEGLLRQQEDLDLLVEDETLLWNTVAVLVGQGWRVDALWLARDCLRSHFTVVLKRPPVDALHFYPERIELLTRSLEGDYWRVRPRALGAAADSPLIFALVSLLEEGVGRRFGARDIYDAALLLESIHAEGLWHASSAAVQEHGLDAEWLCMERHLSGAGVRTPKAHRPKASPLHMRAVSARRRLGWMREIGAPIRLTTLGCAHLLRRRGSRLAARALTQLQSRVGAERLVSSGVPMFGIPLDGQVSVSGVSVSFTGPVAVLRTPVGRYLLSAGGNIPEEWIDQAAVRDEPQSVRDQADPSSGPCAPHPCADVHKHTPREGDQTCD